VSGEESRPETSGVGWFAASLDQILDLARVSDLDAGLADDLAGARDLALMIDDWAKHRAGCGDYFFTVTIHMRSEDKVGHQTFSVPHDPDAAEFIAKLTTQLGLLAGRRARDEGIVRALTELTAVAAGLTKALVESLSNQDEPG
jgi:hypothetical protein